MGNDDHGALALVQHPGQPVDAVDVQVVGRFIQQQDVRVRKECLGEQYTQLPARRYLLHQTEVQGFLDARFQQQFASAALGGIAVHLRELDFQFGHAHAIVFAHFRQRVNALALLLHFPQCRVAHDDSVYHAVVFEGELVLTQYTQGATRFNRHVAGSGGECATQNFHERGLAAAVGPDQAVAVAVAKFGRNVFKQRLGTELHGDVRGGNQERIPASERMGRGCACVVVVVWPQWRRERGGTIRAWALSVEGAGCYPALCTM